MDDIGLIARNKSVTSRAEVIERLRAHEAEIRALGATALALYGSAARDELTAASDVDLFMDYNPVDPPSLFDLARLQRRLGEELGREVDITTRDGLHPMLKEEIEAGSIKAF
jgi:uncharacterized protein